MKYHKELPPLLQKWHTYPPDAGHSIHCILKAFEEDAKKDPSNFMIPIPVKYVLEKGWETVNIMGEEYVVVDAPYSREIGLDIPDKYTEYNTNYSPFEHDEMEDRQYLDGVVKGILASPTPQNGYTSYTHYPVERKTAVLLLTTQETINECRLKKIECNLEMRDVFGFPLIRMIVTIHDRPNDPLRFELFFNLTRDSDIKSMQKLTQQNYIEVHFYRYDNFEYQFTLSAEQTKKECKHVEKILNKALEIIQNNNYSDYDFEVAKRKFFKNNPM